MADNGKPLAPTRRLLLAVVCAEPSTCATWAGQDFSPAGFDVLVLYLEGDSVGPEAVARGRSIHRRGADEPLPRPDFAALVDCLVQADACLLVGESAWVRLVRLVADELHLPIFNLVEQSEQLSLIGRQDKPRPDLLLISGDLLELAMDDPRYGSTLLPVGRPVSIPAGAGGEPNVDVEAMKRLLEWLADWPQGRLAPAELELSIIVPCYNEAGNVAVVCERLLAATADLAAEVLLVDDHSTDDTFDVALQLAWHSPRIRVFRKPPPRGMGNAIRFGLNQTRARYVAVTMGDGSDEVERLPEMLARVRDDGYGLAIGSRYRHRRNYASVPPIYRFWSACFRLVTRVFIGFRLSDYTNAFRVFDRRIFDRYGPESGGFEISPEITFKAWYATGRIAEVDVRHLKRASGQSSFSFLRAGPGYGKILLKAWIQRLTGRWFVLDW